MDAEDPERRPAAARPRSRRCPEVRCALVTSSPTSAMPSASSRASRSPSASRHANTGSRWTSAAEHERERGCRSGVRSGQTALGAFESRRGQPGHDAASVSCWPGRRVSPSAPAGSSASAWPGAAQLGAAGGTRRGRSAATIGGGRAAAARRDRAGRSGESYVSPWLFVVAATRRPGRSRGRAARVRAVAAHPAEQPVTLNVWEGRLLRPRDAARLERIGRALAARVGVERFVLDDGWFHARRDDTAGLGGLVGRRRRSGRTELRPLVGSRPARSACSSGCWFEPEMVNPDSDLLSRAPGLDPVDVAAGCRGCIARPAGPRDLSQRRCVFTYLLEQHQRRARQCAPGRRP